MNRRRFVQRGLFGAAVLLLGGGGLSLYPTRHLASPSKPLRVLDDRGFQVIVAVAARVITAPDADPALLAERIDESLSRVSPEAQADLASLVGLFENALPGLLLDGRATPFTRLGGAAQDRALASWRDSHLVVRRSGYHALRRLCFVAYYGDERAWPGIHYKGPPDVNGFFHDDSKAGTPEWIAAQDAKAGAP
ncbi:MAG: hypothetical protein ABJE95_21065 [Byssovorax sp.]